MRATLGGILTGEKPTVAPSQSIEAGRRHTALVTGTPVAVALPMPSHISALVLAGGDGTRLHEYTRRLTGAPIPKQYCRITGDRSLLETTLARVASLTPPSRRFVVVNEDHRELARDQLGSVPVENVLVQPRNLDTGPGLLFSLISLARREPGARVAVFPSDHYIGDPERFVHHVGRAAGLLDALPDKIVLLGIEPDRPDPELGYVEPAEPVGLDDEGAAFHVGAFREKPSTEHAQAIVARGALWNSFVMVFRLARMLELLACARPDDFERLWWVTDDPVRLTDAYASLPRWNFSRDFLAHVPEHQVVLRADGVDWSDWGTPQAIERTLQRRDPAGVAPAARERPAAA